MNLATFRRLLGALERENLGDTDTLSGKIERARQYVDSHIYRADVVTEVPTSAPAGYLMVKAGDPFLYVGRGSGNKLARTPLELVP